LNAITASNARFIGSIQVTTNEGWIEDNSCECGACERWKMDTGIFQLTVIYNDNNETIFFEGTCKNKDSETVVCLFKHEFTTIPSDLSDEAFGHFITLAKAAAIAELKDLFWQCEVYISSNAHNPHEFMSYGEIYRTLERLEAKYDKSSCE
jgi:hypothetical protein